MKNYVVNGCMKIVSSNDKYNEEQLEIIKYGIEGLYLQISKLVIITFIAIVLGIFKELVIFLLIYNVIRSMSFGLHATKSWICLLSSTLIFINSTILSMYITIPIYIKTLVNIILIGFIFKNAPADTHKKPIVSPKRRQFYKYSSTFIAIIFAFCSLLINDNFLSNCFILSMLVQSFMIAPSIYKLFGLPYNNYLNYMANNDI